MVRLAGSNMDIQHMRVILHFIGFLMLITKFSNGQSVTLTGPSVVEQGSDTVYICTGGAAPYNFKWTDVSVDSGSYIFVGGKANYPSFEKRYVNFDVSDNEGTSTMTISNTQIENGGAYRCTEGEATDEKELTVEVASASQEIYLTNIDDFANYQATCDAIGSKPEENITWVLDSVTQTDGIVETDPDTSADLLFDKRSVFTFPASLDNYNVSLVCEISGHQVSSLNRQESRRVDVQNPPHSEGIIFGFSSDGTDLTVTCNTRACVAAAIPPIDSFYICSNGTLNPCVSEDNAVLNIPEQYTEFTCVAKNYLGNTTTSRTYDPDGPTICSCDFECDTCTFTQATTESIDWERNKGSTSTGNTGPENDHTIGTAAGYYIYTEATDSPYEVARLESELILASSGRLCAVFWYHMWGEDMGTINVYAQTGTTTGQALWTQSGDLGEKWFEARIDVIPSADFKFVFEGVVGVSFRSDMALDDIYIKTGACIETTTAPTEAITELITSSRITTLEEGTTTTPTESITEPLTSSRTTTLKEGTTTTPTESITEPLTSSRTTTLKEETTTAPTEAITEPLISSRTTLEEGKTTTPTESIPELLTFRRITTESEGGNRDVNDCAIDTGLCYNGRCVNLDGSYTCVCNAGFTLENAHSCNALSSSLFISRVTVQITGHSLNGKTLTYTTELTERSSAIFMEYDVTFCFIFSQYVRGQLGSQLVGDNCIVTSFSQGSIVGNVQMELAATSQSVADRLAMSLSAVSFNVNQALTAYDQTLEASISANVQCDQSNCQNGGACTSSGQPCNCPAGFTGDLCQNAPQGLSDGAIIGIALGLFCFVCVLVSCVCCVFMQGVRRNQGIKSMFAEGRYEDPSRRNRGFYRDEGQYGVGQELYRLGGTVAPV